MTRRMSKLVHVVESPTNRAIIEILRTKPPLNDVDFRMLPYGNGDLTELARAIRAIAGEAVLIWGDGETHQLSHYFDLDHGIKRIYDNHDDCNRPNGKVSCANHVEFTAQTETVIQLALTRWCIGYLIDYLSKLEAQGVDIGKFSIASIRARIINKDAGFPETAGRIHLSYDLDCLNSFPARWDWITLHGFALDDLLGSIDLATQTGLPLRLDLGGIVNGFEHLVSVMIRTGWSPGMQMPDLAGIDFDTVLRVSRLCDGMAKGELKEEPEVIVQKPENRILAEYVLYAYYSILTRTLFNEN